MSVYALGEKVTGWVITQPVIEKCINVASLGHINCSYNVCQVWTKILSYIQGGNSEKNLGKSEEWSNIQYAVMTYSCYSIGHILFLQ